MNRRLPDGFDPSTPVRRRWPLVVGAVVLATAGGVGVGAWLNMDGGQPSSAPEGAVSAPSTTAPTPGCVSGEMPDALLAAHESASTSTREGLVSFAAAFARWWVHPIGDGELEVVVPVVAPDPAPAALALLEDVAANPDLAAASTSSVEPGSGGIYVEAFVPDVSATVSILTSRPGGGVSKASTVVLAAVDGRWTWVDVTQARTPGELAGLVETLPEVCS